MTQRALLDGLPVTLGGQAWVMPSLSAKAARQYWPRITALEKGEEPDPLGLVAALVAACLQRNYPEVAAEQVADWIDMDNFEELSVKVFGKGSFAKWTAAHAAAAGNAPPPPPVTAAGAGIGAASTPPSPPPPAGDSPTSTP
jgi:hypothetical protein